MRFRLTFFLVLFFGCHFGLAQTSMVTELEQYRDTIDSFRQAMDERYGSTQHAAQTLADYFSEAGVPGGDAYAPSWGGWVYAKYSDPRRVLLTDALNSLDRMILQARRNEFDGQHLAYVRSRMSVWRSRSNELGLDMIAVLSNRLEQLRNIDRRHNQKTLEEQQYSAINAQLQERRRQISGGLARLCANPIFESLESVRRDVPSPRLAPIPEDDLNLSPNASLMERFYRLLCRRMQEYRALEEEMARLTEAMESAPESLSAEQAYELELNLESLGNLDQRKSELIRHIVDLRLQLGLQAQEAMQQSLASFAQSGGEDETYQGGGAAYLQTLEATNERMKQASAALNRMSQLDAYRTLVERQTGDIDFESGLSDRLDLASGTLEKLGYTERASQLATLKSQLDSGRPLSALGTGLESLGPLLDRLPVRGAVIGDFFTFYAKAATEAEQAGHSAMHARVNVQLGVEDLRPEANFYTREQLVDSLLAATDNPITGSAIDDWTQYFQAIRSLELIQTPPSEGCRN